MSHRPVVLFTPERKATPLFMAAWRHEGGLQPILSGVELLDENLSAKPTFRGLWRRAFPDKQPLPLGPLANKDGRGSDAFWDVFE